MSRCVLGPAAITTLSEDDGPLGRAVSLAAGAEGALATWTLRERGAQNVAAQWIGVDDEPSRRIALTEDVFVQMMPSSTRAGSGYLGVWVDNHSGTFELSAATLTFDPVVRGATQRLTNNTTREESPVVHFSNEVGLLFYVDAVGENPVLRAQTIDDTGTPMGESVQVSPTGQTPRAPAAASLREGRRIVSWQSGNEAWIRLLDEGGMPTGEALRVDDAETVVGAPSVAAGVFGTAVAYDVRVAGVREEFRLRLLDADDEILPSIAAPLDSGEQAANVAIAPLAEGFVALYRAIEASDLEGPTMRLVTLNAQGRVVQRVDLTSTSATGGPSSIVTTDGGAFVAAWSDRTDSGVRFRVAAVRCAP